MNSKVIIIYYIVIVYLIKGVLDSIYWWSRECKMLSIICLELMLCDVIGEG